MPEKSDKDISVSGVQKDNIERRNSYIKAVIIMGVFTFVFLGAEYLFVNVVSNVTSESGAVFFQNCVLGISAVGFALYPIYNRYVCKASRVVPAVVILLISVVSLIVLSMGISYGIILVTGFTLFFLLGITGSSVYYTATQLITDRRYIARVAGTAYMTGVLLQFANNNFVKSDIAEAVFLSLFLILLDGIIVVHEAGIYKINAVNGNVSGANQNYTEAGQKSGVGNAVGVSLIILIVFMTCIFSTLDNAVTLVHAAGTVNIGQAPRLLLAASGIVSGFLFDIKNRRFMDIIMYCVMVMSIMSVVMVNIPGAFITGLVIFYISAGFFAVFFTAGFMELSYYMKTPELWAGLGRAVNNITAAVITSGSLTLLSNSNSVTSIVVVLLLFVAASVMTYIYAYQRKNILEVSLTEEAATDEKDRLGIFMIRYEFTDREKEACEYLINTDSSVQDIADNMHLSRRTVERYISSIYEKTGVKSRVGLLRVYNEED